MKNRHFLIVIVASLNILSLSGEEYSYSVEELLETTRTISRLYNLQPYQVPLNDHPVSGISLLELFPLMEWVEDFEVLSGHGAHRIAAGDSADAWGELFFVPDRREPSLVFGDTVYSDIRGIRFSGDPLDPDSLEVWIDWEGDEELRREIEAFARRHGFDVTVSWVPGTGTKLAAIARARGSVPDLVMVQSSSIQPLVDVRALQALDYISFADLLPQGRYAFTIDGHLWAMPFYFDTQVVFYNRRLFPAIEGERWTLAEMESRARRIRGDDVYPMVWNAYASNWLIPFQISWGKRSLLEEDGTITVFDPPTLASLEYLLDLRRRELLVPMERDAMDALFIAGRVGMILSGSYAIPYLETLDIDFGVMPYPVNQETGLPVSPLLDFKGFVMTRQTRHPLLARRLLQYLYGYGVQMRFCEELHKLSVRSGVRSLSLESMEYGATLERTVESGTVIPPVREYSVYKNNMWKLLRFAFSGQMSAEETLRTGQALMDADR